MLAVSTHKSTPIFFTFGRFLYSLTQMRNTEYYKYRVKPVAKLLHVFTNSGFEQETAMIADRTLSFSHIL